MLLYLTSTSICLLLSFFSPLFAASSLDTTVPSDLAQTPIIFPLFPPCELVLFNTCGKYKLTNEIYSGLFVKVFNVENIENGDPFILKIIKNERSEDAVNEIKILTILNHQKIHKYIDFFQSDKYKFIVFPDDNAISVDTFLGMLLNSDFPYLSIDEIRLFGANLLRLIDYLQSKNIAHADLKPHNILVDQDTGDISLIDFGSAQLFSSKTQKFPGGKSTPKLCAPESCQASTLFSLAVDFYSLGTSLAYLVTQNNLPRRDFLSHPSFSQSPAHTLLLDLITKLTEPRIEDRLVTSSDIKKHAFFSEVDWSLAPEPPFARFVPS